MLNDILYTLITTFGATFVAFICTYIKKKINTLTQNQTINTIVEIVTDSCNKVSMEIVDDLKKAGAFNEDAKQQAKKSALEIIDSLVKDEGKELVTKIYGDFETWVDVKIESILKDKKEG